MLASAAAPFWRYQRRRQAGIEKGRDEQVPLMGLGAWRRPNQ